MLLGVISDTHDRLASIDESLRFFASHNVDRVIHCGDWKSLATAVHLAEQAAALRLPVIGVLGNNDLDVSGFLNYARIAPGDFTLIEGVYEFALEQGTAAVYHGHHAPTLRKVRANPDYRLVLLGHTHKPLIEHDGDRLLVNPGSTAFAIPRSKGFKPSVALVDTATVLADLHYL